METASTKSRSTAATVAVYALGLALLVIAFFAQELADAIPFPRGVSVDTAAMIGGIAPVVLGVGGYVIWYHWFRRRPGSIMFIIGGIAFVKSGGALITRLIEVYVLSHS